MTRRGRPPHPDILTPAEWRVVELTRHGLTTGAIARRLGVSHRAVRSRARAARDKLGLPGRDALRHWDGVRAGSARITKGQGMDLTLGPLGQIARTVEDLDRARAFFRDRLGLRELYAFPGLAFLDLGGTRLMLRETGMRGPADILYFRVPDIAAAHSALSARGVAFSGAPHLIHRHPDGTGEWMAFFTDDEGRDLALHMQAGPAAAPAAG
ncbi:MAG: LuxR C-terminal-related transcriptional regulator [Rhodobacteraceae bacterium]|nr:LuxR C-terminal-related transcriptional regulator [Paracoccaceae bacterium]